jgi:hypothetical protein
MELIPWAFPLEEMFNHRDGPLFVRLFLEHLPIYGTLHTFLCLCKSARWMVLRSALLRQLYTESCMMRMMLNKTLKNDVNIAVARLPPTINLDNMVRSKAMHRDLMYALCCVHWYKYRDAGWERSFPHKDRPAIASGFGPRLPARASGYIIGARKNTKSKRSTPRPLDDADLCPYCWEVIVEHRAMPVWVEVWFSADEDFARQDLRNACESCIQYNSHTLHYQRWKRQRLFEEQHY